MNRDNKGRYTRKGTVVTWVLLLGMVILGIAWLSNSSTTITVNNEQVATTTPEVTTDPLDEIKARENFKKRVENQAKQVYLSEEIADRKEKIAVLEAEIQGIEVDLETTRHEELSFQ